MRDVYIVRLIHTFNVSGGEHTGYHGPYASFGEASDAADALEDHYRTWPMHVNGRECHTSALVETLMPPPRPRQRRYDQCDETCTVDCGHCKGRGLPVTLTGVAP